MIIIDTKGVFDMKKKSNFSVYNIVPSYYRLHIQNGWREWADSA